jgi:hypothetical protein
MKEKPIYFTNHAKKRMEERQVEEKEVVHAIRNNKWESSEERFSTSEVFPFNKYHYGRYYKLKEVIPIFVEEEKSIWVITVYSFFFQGG